MMCDKQQNKVLIRTALVITYAALTDNALVACKPIRKTSHDKNQILTKVPTVDRQLKVLQKHLEYEIRKDMVELYQRYNLKVLESTHMTKKTFSVVRKLKGANSLFKLLRRIDLYLKKYALDLGHLQKYKVQSKTADVSELMLRRKEIMDRLKVFLNLTIEESDDIVWPEEMEMGLKVLVKVPNHGGVGLMIGADLNFIKNLNWFLITAIDQLHQCL